MKKILAFALLVVFGCCSLLEAFAVEPPAELYGIGVSIRRVELNGRDTPFVVWYPAKVKPGDDVFDYYDSVDGRAVLDAEPDAGGAPYPLIIFSSGYFGCAIQSVFFTEHLAAAGYVVAGPDHIDAFFCSSAFGANKVGYIFGGITGTGSEAAKQNFQRSNDLLKSNDWTFRTDDVSAAIDYMLAENSKAGLLEGMVDGDRIGVTGHSLGGWTSFAIGGLEVVCTGADVEGVQGGSLALEVDLCSADVYKDKTTSLRDPRVKAILGLSPSVWAYPNNRGEPALEIPSMIITGAKRDIGLEDIRDTYDHLPPPRYEIIVKGVDHMTIADMLHHNPAAPLLTPTVIFNYSEKLELYMNYSAAFFNAFLRGDKKALEYINGAHYKRGMHRADAG